MRAAWRLLKALTLGALTGTATCGFYKYLEWRLDYMDPYTRGVWIGCGCTVVAVLGMDVARHILRRGDKDPHEPVP